ncbi:MAG: GMC family oxidoreductase [Planctomycetota bacterium]
MKHFDALIIGAGPTGAVATKRLLEAGMRVVVLEQGDWRHRDTARADQTDFELTALVDWAASPNRRRDAADYPIQDAQSDITPLLFNGVGGSSVMYAAQWQRNLPSDFCVRTLDGVADDWPLTYEELEPFYQRVEEDFGISGQDGDPAYPPGFQLPLPPLPMSRVAKKIAKAHNDLGWHWWPASNAIATRPYRSLNPCSQRGTCMWGCVEGAKASVDITHWPNNVRRGAQLITGARVQRLEVNAQGLVTGAHYINRDGHEHFQAADVTVLGANGIGTPRILLLSSNGRYPNGLANSSGLVGKRLMMHPFNAVVGLFDENLGTTHGAWGQQIHCLQFYESDSNRGFVRGAKWGLQPTGGPLAMTRYYPWGSDLDIWGDPFHRVIEQRLGRSATWGIIAEDLPDEANCVELDSEWCDDDGIPAPRLTYKQSDHSNRLLAFHLDRASESLKAAGAYETIVAPKIREIGWHMLGTCKMGDDPETSVVNRWGQTHDIANLFIFDGSIWPTSSGMNPTATIAAMALRCAEHLIEKRHRQRVPS